MVYSLLIYGDEGAFPRLNDSEKAAVMARHRAFQEEYRANGRMGPTARLLGTSTAVTVRQRGGVPIVLDGPFAETKEQLLGFYLVEGDSLEEAIEAAKQLPLDVAAVEVRPVLWFGAGPLRPQGDE